MKIASFFCFLLLSVGSVFGQEIDQRLLTKYSQQELETMIATNATQYAVLDYALDNGIYIANYDNAKGGDFPTISIDPNALPTFVELNLDILDQNQYFKIEGQEKLLVVKSASVLNYEMNKK